MGKMVIYCRVSTEEQSSDDSYSLPNQESRCKEYIKAKGWKDNGVEVIKEVGSGKDLKKRPKYKQILKDIKNDKVSKVMVYRLDRLSRSARDVYDFLDLVSENKVEFISVTESFDTTTPMGRAMLGIAAVFSQLTRETISDNCKDGLRQRKKQGLYPVKAPYGYVNTVNEAGVKVIIPGTKPRVIDGKEVFDEVEHPEVVKMIYDLYLNKNFGLAKIGRTLAQKEIPTWKSPETKTWSFQAIQTILDNPTYAGLLRLDGKLVEGKHEPIIDKATWLSAQQKRKEKKSLGKRMQTNTTLLSGVVRCMKCNRAMVVHYSNTKVPYKEMRCPGNLKVGKEACRGFDVKAVVLEEILLTEIKKLAESDLFQKQSVDEVKKALMQDNAFGQKEKLKNLDSRLYSLDEQFVRWSEAYSKGSMTYEQFERFNKKLLNEQAQLEEEKAEIETELESSSFSEVQIEEVVKMIKSFPRLWKKMEIGEQKEFLRLVVEHYRVAKHECKLKLIFGEEKKKTY